jgi:hypothetical protein
MSNIDSKGIPFIIIIILLPMFSNLALNTNFNYVFADSKSFVNSIVIDTKDDDKLIESDKYNIPINILSANYMSNGKFLNATIWLSKPIIIQQYADYMKKNISFQMLLYILGGKDGINLYNITIRPIGHGIWDKTIQQNITYGNNKQNVRTLEVLHNYTNFFENGHKYIDFSINLNLLGFPDNYVIYFKTHGNIDGKELTDSTQRVSVPPKINAIISELPENISLYPGSEKNVTFFIRSVDLNEKTNILFNNSGQSKDVNLLFHKSPITIPTNGTTSTNLIIKTAGNATPGIKTLTVLVNARGISGIKSPHWNQTFNIKILQPLATNLNLDYFTNILRNNPITYFLPTLLTSIFYLVVIIQNKITIPKDLEKKNTEIIALNAATITGVLFFMTLAKDIHSQNTNTFTLISLMTASIVYPFAISIIRVLTKGIVEGKALQLTVIGFIYLMITIIIIAFIR